MTNNYTYNETEDYLQAVKQHLIDTFGVIKPQWLELVNMLGTHYDLFLTANKSIKEDGIMYNGKINPSVKILQDTAVRIEKIQQALAITPQSELRLKLLKPKDGDEDNFLKDLLNG